MSAGVLFTVCQPSVARLYMTMKYKSQQSKWCNTIICLHNTIKLNFWNGEMAGLVPIRAHCVTLNMKDQTNRMVCFKKISRAQSLSAKPRGSSLNGAYNWRNYNHNLKMKTSNFKYGQRSTFCWIACEIVTQNLNARHITSPSGAEWNKSWGNIRKEFLLSLSCSYDSTASGSLGHLRI